MDLDQDESRMLTAPSEEFHASRSSQESISPAEGVVGEPEPVQEVNTQAAAKSVSFSPRLEAAILSLTAPVTPHEQLEELDRARQAGSVVIAIPAVVPERRFSLPSVRGVGDRRFSVVSALSAASMGKKVCRFCWDGSGELVSSGCQCHDSFLHQECLLRWIESNKRKEKVVCEICLVKHEVVFEPVLQERLEMLLKEKEALEMEDRPPVVRHPRLARVVLVLSICLIIMAVLLVIAYVVVFALSLNPTP